MQGGSNFQAVCSPFPGGKNHVSHPSPCLMSQSHTDTALNPETIAALPVGQ